MKTSKRKLSGRTMLSVLLFVSAVAAIPSSVYAGGRKDGGSCTGPTGCDGSTDNGPQGYTWQDTPCQFVASGTEWDYSCLDADDNNSGGSVFGAQWVSVTYYPTIVCSGGTGDCINVKGFKCREIYVGSDCLHMTLIATCYKDYACAHKAPPG